MFQKILNKLVFTTIIFVLITLISSCATTAPRCLYIDPNAKQKPIVVEVYTRAYVDYNEYTYLAEVDGEEISVGSTRFQDKLMMSSGVHSFLYKMNKNDSKPVKTEVLRYELIKGYSYVLDVDVCEETDKYILIPKIKKNKSI